MSNVIVLFENDNTIRKERAITKKELKNIERNYIKSYIKMLSKFNK